LLGEEFDRDPFLIFKLRGLERDALVALLSASGARPRGAEDATVATPPPPVPLVADPVAFWAAGEAPAPGEVVVPDPPPALLARLGPFPFWRGEAPIAAALGAVYVGASLRALDVVLGLSRSRTS